MKTGRACFSGTVEPRNGLRSGARVGAIASIVGCLLGACSSDDDVGTAPESCSGAGGGTAGSAGAGGKAGSSGTTGNAGTAGSTTGGGQGDGGESSMGAAAGNGGEDSGEPPPPDCDPNDLEDGCVRSAGIFVSTSGDDDNDGTASEPLATISAAVTLAASTGAPIFVCGGTYAEHVVITEDNLEIHGGFACPRGDAAWVYDSAQRPRIAPTTTGYALRVTNVDGLTVTDLEFESADAEKPGESSVAVFLSRSVDVEFTRVWITAGDGMRGVDGTREESNHFSGSLKGLGAMADEGGVFSACSCDDGTMSVGGGGGDGGLSPSPGGAGSPDEGAGQPGIVGSCAAGGTGQDGGNATASPDGPGAMTFGSLTTSGWAPSSGTPGPNGTPGQGGGGGAGAASGGGGGGACGGCGGKGGGAGTGGGGSIGLASFRSTVSLTSVTIATGDAGDGGAGIDGEVGQVGGTKGGGGSFACDGGNGGTGADGAAGGGGAGGISVGILSTSNSNVTAASMTYDIGMAGDAGPAAMGSTNAGVPGVADETLDVG
jgi:hypothetical protein